MGHGRTLRQTISAAFPGRSLEVLSNDSQPWGMSPRNMELSVGLTAGDLRRTLVGRELSDGTLRFLCLAACLLSPRPPALIALNEPESSLHTDLLGPLAKLIVDASKFSQAWVSTLSQTLVEQISSLAGVDPIQLKLVDGETVIV